MTYLGMAALQTPAQKIVNTVYYYTFETRKNSCNHSIRAPLFGKLSNRSFNLELLTELPLFYSTVSKSSCQFLYRVDGHLVDYPLLTEIWLFPPLLPR